MRAMAFYGKGDLRLEERPVPHTSHGVDVVEHHKGRSRMECHGCDGYRVFAGPHDEAHGSAGLTDAMVDVESPEVLDLVETSFDVICRGYDHDVLGPASLDVVDQVLHVLACHCKRHTQR